MKFFSSTVTNSREYTYDKSGPTDPVIDTIYHFKDHPSIVKIKERSQCFF